MASAMNRRLARIEKELMPPILAVVCIDEPVAAADAAAWAGFHVSLAKAHQSGSRVIVARESCPISNREYSNEYRAVVMSRFEAATEILACKPSSCGNKSALDDLIKRVTNSSPILTVKHPEDLCDEDDD